MMTRFWNNASRSAAQAAEPASACPDFFWSCGENTAHAARTAPVDTMTVVSIFAILAVLALGPAVILAGGLIILALRGRTIVPRRFPLPVE